MSADVPTLLDRVRAALGAPATPPAADLLLTGSGRHFGEDGGFTWRVAADGRFAIERDGRLGGRARFDGTTGVGTDWSGVARVLELEDLEDQQLVAWVLTGRWLDRPGGLEIDADPDTDDGHPTLRLRLPGSPRPARVALDADGRPHRASWTSARGEQAWTVLDWQDGPAGAVPARLLRDSAGIVDEQQVERVVLEDRDDDARFTLDLARPDDHRFVTDGPALQVKTAPTGHLLVRPEVDGEDLGWFVLDSGAGSMVIDPAGADACGMDAFGRIVAVGAAGRVDSRFRQGKLLRLGPLELRDTVYSELDLSGVAGAMDELIGGIIGYDVFARCVVEVDMATHRLALHEPAAWTPPAGSRAEPLVLHNKLPCVRCRFEGDHQGVFRIDTGAGQVGVLFNAPAVEALGLLDARPTAPLDVGGGVGGALDFRLGTLGWLELAGERHEELPAFFAQARDGAVMDAYTVGNLGGGVLGRFALAFDYPGRRLHFRRHAAS